MFKYYFTYLESNERKKKIINLQNWTDEQKEEIKTLIDKKPQLASQINWQQKELDYEEVKSILTQETRTQFKKDVRKGFEGLVEGEDYKEVSVPEELKKKYHCYLCALK